MKKNLLISLIWVLFLKLISFSLNGQTANSLSFDGVNDYVARSVFSTQQVNVTFEARIKVLGASLPSNRYILANGTGTTGFGLYLNMTNQVIIRMGAMNYTTTYSPPPGTFVLLSVVVTPNFLNFYVNGVQTATFIGGLTPAPSSSFVIGSRDGTADYFGGDIDEVRYWIRPVCQQEILHRVNCSATGLEPQLAALYKFNQGVAAGNNATVTTLNDQTPNMHHAILYNFALNGASSNWVNSAGAYGGQCSIAPLTLSITTSPGNIICNGQSATLTALGGMSGTYTWNTNQTTQSIVVTPTAGGIYSVIAQSSVNCYGMAISGLSVMPQPTVTVNSASTCAGQSITLSASGATSYTWNTGANTSSIIVNPTVTTNYTVTGANGFCSDTKTTQVTVNSASASIISSGGNTVCTNVNFNLTAGGNIITYTWNTGANTSSITQNITAPGTYSYSVSGTAANGCTATAVQTIVVQLCGGIMELNQSDIKVFPNPFYDKLEINSSRNLKIRVYDINTKLLLVFEGKDIIINTENWINGIYFIEIEDSKVKYRGKVVKE